MGGERRSRDGSNVLQYVSVKGSMLRVSLLPGMCQVPGVLLAVYGSGVMSIALLECYSTKRRSSSVFVILTLYHGTQWLCSRFSGCFLDSSLSSSALLLSLTPILDTSVPISKSPILPNRSTRSSKSLNRRTISKHGFSPTHHQHGPPTSPIRPPRRPPPHRAILSRLRNTLGFPKTRSRAHRISPRPPLQLHRRLVMSRAIIREQSEMPTLHDHHPYHRRRQRAAQSPFEQQ